MAAIEQSRFRRRTSTIVGNVETRAIGVAFVAMHHAVTAARRRIDLGACLRTCATNPLTIRGTANVVRIIAILGHRALHTRESTTGDSAPATGTAGAHSTGAHSAGTVSARSGTSGTTAIDRAGAPGDQQRSNSDQCPALDVLQHDKPPSII